MSPLVPLCPRLCNAKAILLKKISHSHYRVLDLSIAQALVDTTTYPSHVEWNELTFNHTDEEFLYELMNFYKGREETAFIALQGVLRDEMVKKGIDFDSGISEYFAAKYLEKGNYDGAIRGYEIAIERGSDKFLVMA